MRRFVIVACLAAVVGVSVWPLSSRAAPSARHDLATSLPAVTSGARPGPAVLYSKQPSAPELENHDPRFRAAPLLVSGIEGYVQGEYLYQDYLNDDRGGSSTSGGGGDYRGRAKYPDDPKRYRGNAADLVEVRIAPQQDSVLYRFTLNTMLVKDAAIISVAWDADRKALTGSATLPRDPGAPFPGTDQVLTTWGTGAELSSWDGGSWQTTPVEVSADLVANQITVTVPRALSDPRGVWRATVAAGVHNVETGGWYQPDNQNNGIYNLGLRFDEPVSTTDVELSDNKPPDERQAQVLAEDNPTAEAHDIDFGLLDRRVTDIRVPASGNQARIFASRRQVQEGLDPDRPDYFPGRLQQYFLYVPSSYGPNHRSGFTFALHSLTARWWQYSNTIGVQQWGEQRDSFVATPDSRGEAGWYFDEFEYDAFEVWNDVAHHFALDPNRASILGYSMGAFGAYRLGFLYPDLFGTALAMTNGPCHGMCFYPTGYTSSPPPGWRGVTNLYLENARHLPYFVMRGALDEFENTGTYQQTLGIPGWPGLTSFREQGYRFQLRNYPHFDHLLLAYLSYEMPGITEFLGEGTVDRDPAHVTFAYLPIQNTRELGLVHDHAYWVSQVTVREQAPPPSRGDGSTEPETVTKSVIDAFSHGLGVGDPTEVRPTHTVGTGPSAHPWTQDGQVWGPLAQIPKKNRLDLTLTNVKSARIATRRAHLDPSCQVEVRVKSDGPATIQLDGIGDVKVARGSHTYFSSPRATAAMCAASMAPKDGGSGDGGPGGDATLGAGRGRGPGADQDALSGAVSAAAEESPLAVTGAAIAALVVLGLALTTTGFLMNATGQHKNGRDQA
ncbi:MAG TPA: hypothetical protein VG929_04590 [Actinomycetota bacterium]|nr:hypothetical protein [Actinomycetota bacterium]